MNKTKAIDYVLKVSLSELYTGSVRRLRVNKFIECDQCLGSGAIAGIRIDVNDVKNYARCENCEGTGQLKKRACRLCVGTGYALLEEIRCGKCNGKKIVARPSVLDVKITPGMRHGQKICFRGEGNQEPHKKPGYVVIFLQEMDHEIFRREKDDLHMIIQLGLVESLCGFTRVITTLDKRQLKISSPAGTIQNSEIKCLPFEGMPFYTNPMQRGDLIITLEVVFPSSISAKHIPSLEKFLPPREVVEIPMDAEECNMIDMDPADEGQNCEDEQHEPQPHFVEVPYEDEHFEHDQYQTEQYEQDHYDEDQYEYQYQCHNQYNYEERNYEAHCDEFQYQHQGYEDRAQPDDCESLESYDATQQFLLNLAYGAYEKFYREVLLDCFDHIRPLLIKK